MYFAQCAFSGICHTSLMKDEGCVDERVCNGIAAAPHGSVELITSENLPVIVARVFPQNLIHLVNPFSKQGVNDSTKRTTASSVSQISASFKDETHVFFSI